MIRPLIKYLSETKVELKKATWPWDPAEKGFKKYRELVDSTIVLIVAIVLLGAVVTTWDLIMRSFFNALLWLSQLGV
jgi:preprotein translocase subunit SecE